MSSSVEGLRELINERLAAAAEEIFGAFSKIIVHFEEEINRQSTLLDIAWKPKLKLHRIDACVQKEERSSRLDQEDPEPLQIKEEQLGLQQDTDALMLTPTNEDRDHTEEQTMCLNPHGTLSAPEEQADDKMPVIVSVVSESNRDHQLLSNNCHLAESPNQKGHEQGDLGSTKTTESRPKKSPHGRKRHTTNEHNSTTSKIHPSVNAGNKSLECDICGKKLKYQSYLKRHMRIHKKTVYICKICGKDFPSKVPLTRHMRIHSGEKKFICKTCGRAFRTNCHLTGHIRTHTDERPFTCETCGEGFRHSSQLTVHKRRAHTGEKPYICNTCGKGFFETSILKMHMIIHSGEKKFICKTCGRAFGLKCNLASHILTHTGEKPHVCKNCGKAFRHKCNLTGHMRTHTGEKPFTCETCGKDFRNKDNLAVHKRRAHTREKPYVCKTCGKSFIEISILKRHIKIHSGEKT